MRSRTTLTVARAESAAVRGEHYSDFGSTWNGKFAARYRFTRTFSRTTYRFRAVIHSDPHFPYAAAASPVVKVRVRP